jgi:hypothetical protein
MSDDAAALTAQVLHQMLAFLRELDARQIRDLASGRATLALVDAAAEQLSAPAAKPAARPPEMPSTEPRRRPRATAGKTTGGGSPPDPAEVKAALVAMSSRDEAREYVSAIGNVSQLRALAGALGVRVLSKERRDDVVRKIVDGTLGVRLSSRAMGDTL